ncbi:hypothetical protein NITMOv2_3664 [Nitrospira moscoviensis]|uniref:Uncharacterized protein n=1 Tax=Nitrospira moscoviensis TaxID=42253 RepID=A0A0K2GGI9_NITMO|nr:hypothetical protein NITMOv2_3664 [Nitrospira moscoviensis]
MLPSDSRYHQAMKTKKVRQKHAKVGVGAVRMKAVLKELRGAPRHTLSQARP